MEDNIMESLICKFTFMFNVFMKRFYLFAVIASLFLSCSVDEYGSLEKENDVVEAKPRVNVLSFESVSELNSVLERLKTADTRDLRDIPLTRSVEQVLDDEGFVSLRQDLINKGLQEFSDDELQEIENEGLVYEPEDSLILDPYLCVVLNEEREVIVGTKAYRFVKDGVIECESDKMSDLSSIERELKDDIDTSVLEEGESVTIEGGRFTKIKYEKEIEVSDDALLSSSESSNGELQLVQQPSRNENEGDVPEIKPVGNTLVLKDGTVIKADKINTVKYLQDESEAGKLQRFISSKFGTNVVANNYYDSKHRMRLRMYSQDYIICSSVGFVVRMQKKKFGIWWRAKADEFRYGWSAIECKYDYSQSPFQGSLPSSSTGSLQSKYPDFMLKKFPFQNENVVLFHIGLINYDFTTGDMNKVFKAGVEKVKDKIQSFVSSENTEQYKEASHGLFTVDKDDLTVYVTYPQDEDVDYSSGREKVEWDFRWFSGTFVIGFSTNMVNSFSLSNLDIAPLNNVEITRGSVYCATKYNGEWRACVIKTVN